jgi:hypothetical protein
MQAVTNKIDSRHTASLIRISKLEEDIKTFNKGVKTDKVKSENDRHGDTAGKLTKDLALQVTQLKESIEKTKVDLTLKVEWLEKQQGKSTGQVAKVTNNDELET